MKYYIIAGEPSGDLHGANLIKGIKNTDPQATFRFWGGDLMKDAAKQSGELVCHYKDHSVMGFWEVIKNIRRITGFMKLCKKDIQNYKPDVLILIDYPGFNLRMAAFAKSIGIPTYYYIAPKVWAWKERRVKKIQAHVDKLFVIFPFEIEYFGKFGIDTFYGGNPLMDSLKPSNNEDLKTFRSDNNLPDKPIIALVAGSRKHEIHFNLPIMMAVACQMTDYHFVVTGVEWLHKELYTNIIDGTKNVSLVMGKTQETLRHSTAALVTSGTATLETALLGVPQVVCFKGPALTMWIAKQLVKIKWISLVNIVMNRTVVKELIQDMFTAERAVSELQAILMEGSGEAEKMKADYKELADKIGGAGSSQRVADEMVKSLRSRV